LPEQLILVYKLNSTEKPKKPEESNSNDRLCQPMKIGC